MRTRMVLVFCAALALSVGVATATAGGGNSENAKKCQKGGWTTLTRADGTPFANQDECVSYAADGGTLTPKPTCTAGSEDFSEYQDGSQPTTFTGGTIDTAYGNEPIIGNAASGGVLIQGTSSFGWFAPGTHLLWSGGGVNSFRLTFTNAVRSVRLDEEPNQMNGSTTDTLTAYDASDNILDSVTEPYSAGAVNTLSVSSTSNNIKYFTIATDQPFEWGINFTNINWSCN
jgi:hypothetical protein